MKAVSDLNVPNSSCLTSGVDYKCRCQTIGCPLPIIVEAQSSRQVAPSVPRMYPQFGKASIQPIDTKGNGAGINPCNNHDFHYFRSKSSGHPSMKNLNSSIHLQSHKVVQDQVLNKNSKGEQRSYHPKLIVTCKAPNSWLRMKWGRVSFKQDI